MTENNNIPEPREGKKLRYRKRVYKFLSNKFSDFKRNESDFYNELDSNPEYASKVYDVIYDNFGDFKKGKDEFVGLMTISKKKEPSTVASRVGGQAGISEVPLGKDKGLGEVTTPKRGFIGPEEYELPKPEEAKAPEEVKITEEVKIPELKVPEVKLPETQLQQQVAEEKPKRTSRIVLEQKDISPFLSFGPSFPLTDRPLPEGSRTIYNFKDNPDAIASESQKYGVKPESLSQVLKDVSADSDDNKIIEAAKVYQYAPSLYKKTIASASWAASIRNGLLQEVKEGEISKEDADNIYNIAAKGKNFSYDPVSKQYVDLNYDEAKSRVLGNAELIKRTVKNTEEQKKALEDLKTDQAGFVLYRYGTSPENQQKWKSINGDLLVGAGLDVLKMTEPEKASEIEKVFSNPDSTLAQKVPYFNDLRNIGYSALQSEVIEKINARNYYDPQQEDPTTSKALDNLYKWYNYLDKKAKEDYSEKYGTQIQEEAKTLEEKAKQERANAPILNKAFRGFSDIASGLSRGAAGTFVNTVDGFATLIKNANLFVPGADPTKLTNFLAKKYEGNIDELFPQTPEFKNSIADQLSQALGQVAAMVLAARAGGGGSRAAAGLAEAIPQTVVKAGATTQAAVSAAAKQLVSGLSNPASVVGALNVGQQEYRRAKEAGASDEQAFEAFVKNGVGGSVLEQIPVMKFFERLNKATSGGVLNYIKTKAVGGITGGIEEMTTEVLQQLYANKTAKDIYNINQDLFEGVTSSGGIGFGAGFILNAMGQRANILRKEGKVKEAQSIEDTVGKIEQRLNIDAQKERDDLAKQGVVLEKAEVTPTAPKEETLTDQVARQIEEQEKAAQAVGEVAPEAAPEVPAAPEVKGVQKKSDTDIEKRMFEIEEDRSKRDEFNALEKEMEKREKASVFNVTLDKVNEAVDALIKKEKEMPNGYGAFIEMKDARETKSVANKYLNASELTDSEINKDFADAVMGNPDTWYADGLRLRESLKEAANRGIDTQKMVDKIVKKFVQDGFTEEEAKGVVARRLAPIFEGSQVAPPELPAAPEKSGAGVSIQKQSDYVQEILGVSNADADVMSLIHNADLTADEKNILWRQWKRGVMSMGDIKRMTSLDLDAISQGRIDKWANAILANKKKGQKIGEDIEFEEVGEVAPEAAPEVPEAPVERLEKEYRGKTVEELVALKKQLYPSPDIETPMSAEEKLLDRVIADKFSEINQSIVAKRKAAEESPRFTSYDDAQKWIEYTSKKYKSKNEFLASQEYKDALPDINALYKVEKADYSKKAKDAMDESGVKIGDRVIYDYVTPFGAETYSGKIVERDGIPFVRFDEGQKTMSGKQSVRWHKGFVKEAAAEAKPELPAAKIENPKVVITGTRNGLENLSSNNYDIKTDAKIKDARGREGQFENGVLIEDDGKGNTIINIKTDAVDSFRRRGFLQASVIVPRGTEVNPERIKSVVEEEVKKLRNQYNTLELGQVQQADLVKLKDAVVRELQGAGEVVAEAAPEVPAAPEKTQDEVAKEQTKETDLLLGGQAEQRRKDGKYTKDGVEYIRNPKGQGIASEVTGEVRFTNEVSLPFKYKLVEAETLQPSHQDGIRNPLHFIPEAQPKNRNDVGSLQAEESFANNPRFSELGENTNAYSGAPVVNERGEVVQGNNRSAGLRKGYQRNNPQYKNDLAANAEQFGFTREQVEGMKNPVLVREVAVSEQGAVELGNYDAKDLETGGKRRVDPIAVTRRMPFDVKGRIADLFTGEETLNQAIRANQKRLLELLNPYLNQAQRNTITKDGVLTDAGIKDLEAVVQQFLFDNGDTALPDLFESLSATQKEGLRKSLPYVFSVSPEKSLVPDIQEAILAVNDFNASGAGEFDAWLLQGDIFNDGKTPKDKYTPLELAIAKTLVESKTQKEIAKKFADYADVVKDKEADMFEPARPGKSRKEGVLEVFKAEDYAKPISERGRKEAAPEKKPTPESSAEKRAGDAARSLAERIREGKIKRKGLQISTGLDAIWDAALEVVATSLEAGASIADAIQDGIRYIRSTDFYKNATNKKQIEDNFANQLNEEYAIQEQAAGEVPVQPEARAGEKVEAGVPPTEPTKAPEEGKAEGEEKRLSGIKKGLVSQEILGSVNFEKTGDKELLEKGRQIIGSGEVNPRTTVDRIVDEGRGVLSPAEVVALIYYKADLDTKVEDLTSEMERMKAAGEDLGDRGVQLKDLEVQQRNFDIAAVITAQQQSMSFRLRRWMLDRAYSLQQRINNYKKVNDGTIPEDVQKKFEEWDKELQSLRKQIRDAEIKKADQDAEVAVDNIVEDVKREDARQQLSEQEIEQRVQKGVEAEINRIYEQLPAKKKSRADQAIAALDRIQARLRNKTYDAGLGIPVAIIDAGITTIKGAIKAGVAIEKAIQLGIDTIKQKLNGKPFDNENNFRQDLLDGFKAEGIKTEKEASETPSVNEDGSLNIPEKFLRDLVRSGKTNIEQLTDAVLKELEPQLPGLTKRQVRDAITEYGRTVNPTKDDIRTQLGAAKRIGRLISEIEDLQGMSPSAFALKYYKSKPKNTSQKERLLKAEVRNLIKTIKADPSLLPLKDAENLNRAKENAKRRIEELQDRISSKDYSKKPKPVVKADAELEMLNAQKEALQERFEEETKLAEIRNRTKLEKVKDFVQELLSNLPRALTTTLDLSAMFVQGTWRVFTSPIRSAKAFAEGLRQLVSPRRMEKFMSRYKSTYDYVIARNSGLAISSPESKASENEQLFVIRYANAIYDTMANIVTLGYKPAANFVKAINPLKASQRAFEGYINYIRISTFKKMSDSLRNAGYNPEYNPEVFKSAADFVNTTTGRANLGALETSSKWLSTIFFAPKKVAAELKLFSPYAFVYYAKMPAPVRKKALMDFAKFSTSVLATHVALRAALEALGEEQEDDFWNPKSPNFMSFKIGEKRLSVLGGAKSTIVFMSRVLGGNTFVDKYGEETKFGERVGKKINTKFDLIIRFVAGKFAPVAGAARDYMDRNPNYEDDDEIYKNLVTPIWMQDLNELYKDDSVAVTGMFNLLSIVGANITKVDFSEVKDQITFTEKIPGGFTKITVGGDTVYKKGRSSEVKRIVKLTEAQKEEFQNLTDERFKVEMDKIAKIVKEAPNLSTRAKYTKIAVQKATEYAQKILEEKYKDQFKQFPIKEKVEDKSEEVKKTLEEQKKKKTIIF